MWFEIKTFLAALVLSLLGIVDVFVTVVDLAIGVMALIGLGVAWLLYRDVLKQNLWLSIWMSICCLLLPHFVTAYILDGQHPNWVLKTFAATLPFLSMAFFVIAFRSAPIQNFHDTIKTYSRGL